MDVKISWEVSYTWDRWKDLNRVLEYRTKHSLEELPEFPKDHFVMTTLLIDDRLNGLTRLESVSHMISRYIQGLMTSNRMMEMYEVRQFFQIASHIRKKQCRIKLIWNIQIGGVLHMIQSQDSQQKVR